MLIQAKHLNGRTYDCTAISRTNGKYTIDLFLRTHYKSGTFNSYFVVKLNQRLLFKTTDHVAAVDKFKEYGEKYFPKVDTSKV